MGQAAECSGGTQDQIDEEVQKLVNRAYQYAPACVAWYTVVLVNVEHALLVNALQLLARGHSLRAQLLHVSHLETPGRGEDCLSGGALARSCCL